MQTVINIGQVKPEIREWIKRVASNGERIILSLRGQPQAALVSMQDLRLLEHMDRAQRLAALDRARALGECVRSEQNVPDLDAASLLHQLCEERSDELVGLR